MRLRRRRRKNPARLRGKKFAAFMLRARRAKNRRKNPHAAKRLRRRRRRSNPSVLLANTRMHAGRSLQRRRRRRNPHRMMMQLRPRRRRRRRNPHRLHHRRHRLHRRRNPMRLSLRGLWDLAKLAMAGGAGVMTARISAYYYTKYAADFVKGTAAKADPKNWRNVLSEALRIIAMAGGVIGGHMVLGKVRVFGESTRTAFLYGGLGESGRQAVGVVVKRLSPASDLDRVGLSGDLVEDEDGNQWLRTADGQFYAVTGTTAGQLADSAEFQGLEDADVFQGLEDADDFNAALVLQHAA